MLPHVALDTELPASKIRLSQDSEGVVLVPEIFGFPFLFTSVSGEVADEIPGSRLFSYFVYLLF